MRVARIAIIIGVLFILGLFFTSTIYAGNYSEEISAGDGRIIKKIPGFAKNPIDSDYLDVIITFKSDVSVDSKGITALSESAKDIKKIPMGIKHNLPIINAVSATIHKDELETIQNLPYVESIELNAKRYALLDVSRTLINADDIQGSPFNLNGSGVKVCILDTGYDFFHENLPTPADTIDLTDWDWYIDGQYSNATVTNSYNYTLNITNSSLGWLEIGLSWLYYNNRYDVFLFYEGALINDTTSLTITNITYTYFPYWVILNLTDMDSNNGTWTVIINETSITTSLDYPTLFWGTNVSHYPNHYGATVSPDMRAFYNNNSQDDYGHGTHVAGIIASNDTIYKGVAPNVNLYIAKVLDSSGAGYTDSITEGIDWCVSKDVDIISMSIGGYDYNITPTSKTGFNVNCNASDARAVDSATLNNNTSVVVAAGNCGAGGASCTFNISGNIITLTGTNTIASPGCARTALTVGSTTKLGDDVPSYSSRGPINGPVPFVKPDLVAPGGTSTYNVLSTGITNRFVGMHGTSMATPHVAGAAALLLQRNSSLKPAEIKVILMNSANQNSLTEESAINGDLSNIYGAGMLDILEAVNKTEVLNGTCSNNTIRTYTINAMPTTVKATLYWEENSTDKHNSLNLTLQRWSGTSWVQVDTSTNSSWVTQQVGNTSAASKWKIIVGGKNVTGNETFYLATNSFVYPSTTLKLISPINNNRTNNQTITFYYNITSTNLSSCILWIANSSNTSTWHTNMTEPTPINNATNNFTQTFADGNYTWNIECNGTYLDTAFSDFNETNRTFVIDTTIPNILINDPVDNDNVTGTFMLNWTIYDLSLSKIWYTRNNTFQGYLTGASNTTNITITTSEGLYNLTIYANDTFNNTNNKTINFTVDKTAPNLTMIQPNGSLVSGNTTELNYTVVDAWTSVQNVWYSLDLETNLSLPDTNSSITLNLTYPGQHNVWIYANDSAGNTISKNITFFSESTMNISNWTNFANSSWWPEINNFTVTNGTDITHAEAVNFDVPLNLTIYTANFNITMHGINGSQVVWQNIFDVTENNTTIQDVIESGSGAIVEKMIYFGGTSEFLNDLYYNVTVSFEFNVTNLMPLYYCSNDINCTKINICSGIFNNTPCYNNISSIVTVYVPHMSTIAATNNSQAPTLNVTSPLNKTYNGTEYLTIDDMLADIRTPIDTVFCNYSLKANGSLTTGSDSKSNSKTALNGSINYTWTIGPLHNGNYNITCWCNDSAGYSNSTIVYFRINDTTAPTFLSSDDKNRTKDSVIIEWITNEYTNGTVRLYADFEDCTGSAISDLTTSDTTFSRIHEVDINDLSSDTEYGYIITAYDYQGKSSTSGCDHFNTLTADSGDDGTESGSSGGETTNTSLSVKETHFWDAISANSETTMDVKSSAIAIDILKFILKESVQGSQMSVQSYGTSVPPGLKAADNFVYQYFDITATFSSKLDLMRINLKIPKSWFTTNNYDPTKVEMYHSKNNTWINEFTEYDGLVGDYYTYHSEITSLSKFAISTVAAPPYVESCGNTVCNQSAGENCSTCQTDCGPCVVINNTNTTNNLTTNNTSNDTNKTTFAFPKMDMEWLKQNRYIILGAVIITVFVALAVLVKSGLLPDEIKMPKIRRPRIDITLPKISRSTEKIKSKSDKKEKNFELEPGQFRLK